MASSLKGRLLVASPALRDPNFDRTVVLVLEHTAEGALGLFLNRPGDVDLSDALPQWSTLGAPPAVVFSGGPVEPGGVLSLAQVAMGSEDEVWRSVAGDLGLLDISRHPEDIGQRVQQVRVFAGCAGWGSGQLESEIAVGAWFVVDPRLGDALSPQPLELWRVVLRREGGELALVSGFPEDPSLN